MPADLPPKPPERRTIEIVPLDGPVTPARPVPAPPAPRPFPHLVVDPVPAWPAPAIRSSRHPAATLATLPEPVRLRLVVDDLVADELAEPVATPPAAEEVDVIDLTAFADAGADTASHPAIDLTVIDLTEHADAAAPVAAGPAPSPLVDAARLRALLAREREQLAAPAAPTVDAPVSPIAPFPLPQVAVRRTPKAVRTDAAATPGPLPGALSAAMARATAALRGDADAPAAPEPGRARDRLDLVPLPDPLPVPAAPATIDLREPASTGAGTLPCPACSTPGAIDVIDQVRGEIHVSCPQCFRMWRSPIVGHAAHQAR